MAGRESVTQLMKAVIAAGHKCPAHGQSNIGRVYYGAAAIPQKKEYAFQIACSDIRYGEGVTGEVGMDFANLGSQNVCVMTDKNVAKLPVMTTVTDALARAKVRFEVFEDVRIEPTDESVKHSIEFCKQHDFDAYLCVGGGSVMDTCKAANLYASKPDSDFLDYINAPVGKGLPVMHELKPLIAVPTTAGTGSETTGTSVFDYKPLQSKTGISYRALLPKLGILDPLNVMTMPNRVAVYTGFDVFCHALESFTALPYTEREPRPEDPKYRPAYQGSNPISDVWSKHALRVIRKYFKRSIQHPDDLEARSEMLLASVFAGIGFGNSGAHLCHGMSYPISGLVKSLGYVSRDYDQDQPLAVSADISNAKQADAGKILGDVIRQYMYDLEVDDGLKALGFTSEHIPGLVKGTLPQQRLIKLAPRPQTEEDLASLFENSMTVYN